MALRPVLTYARSRGVDVTPILAKIGLLSSDIGAESYDRRIPDADRRQVWTALAAQLRDPCFGLNFGRNAPIGAYDALDYAVSLSTTWGDAITRILRFHRILCDAWTTAREVELETVRLRRVERTPAHEAEAWASVLVARGRELTGISIVPHEVRFSHEKTTELTPYIEFFRCPVRHGCTDTELVFRASDLELPVPRANPGLNRVLDRYMAGLLDRLGHGDPFVELVRASVARMMKDGARPTLQGAAAALHASPRTVQRKLSELGTTYVAVVESARRGLGERLVADGRLSLTEIAFLLGFSDVSGFRRAYKAWTGANPSAVRARSK